MKIIAGLAAVLCAVLSSAALAHSIPAACQSDASTLCPGMAPGDGKFGKCMKSHGAQVSSGCKQAARELRRERKAHKRGNATTGVQPTLPSNGAAR